MFQDNSSEQYQTGQEIHISVIIKNYEIFHHRLLLMAIPTNNGPIREKELLSSNDTSARSISTFFFENHSQGNCNNRVTRL